MWMIPKRAGRPRILRLWRRCEQLFRAARIAQAAEDTTGNASNQFVSTARLLVTEKEPVTPRARILAMSFSAWVETTPSSVM